MGGGQHLPRVADGLIGDFHAAQHAGDFLNTLFQAQRPHLGVSAIAVGMLADLEMMMGLGGDLPLSATRQIEEDKVRIGLQGLQLVDTRVRLMPLDDLRDAAPDEYVLTRDAWLQRRNYLIEADRHRRAGDGDLPDYLRDEERDPTVPADAIPLPGG